MKGKEIMVFLKEQTIYDEPKYQAYARTEYLLDKYRKKARRAYENK